MSEALDQLIASANAYASEQVIAAVTPLQNEIVRLQGLLATGTGDLNAAKARIAELEKKLAEVQTPAPTPAPTPTPDPAPTGWKLEWQDDFTKIDTTVWSVDASSSYGSGNKHEQVNTNRSKNVRIAANGAALVVEAHREDPPLKVEGNDPLIATYPNGRPYSSGNIKSKKSFRFGATPIRFEVRAKMPMGPGFLPCPLWLRPVGYADGEIDLVESTTKDPLAVSQNFHQSYTATPRSYGKTTKLTTPFTEWHTYAAEVENNIVTFYIDGKQTHRITPQNLSRMTTILGVDRDWIMRISLAVGGSWVGAPTAATKFPAPMQVDWIKVYRRG
jgi:beta-glucanase (GH16 family)